MSMEKLVALARDTTGKDVHHQHSLWCQDEARIFIPEEDEQGLVHEILHWVVATPEEREWPNLALDKDEVNSCEQVPRGWDKYTPDAREREVYYLESIVYADRGWFAPATSYDPRRFHVSDAFRATVAAKVADFPGLMEQLSGAMTTGWSEMSQKCPDPLDGFKIPFLQ